MLLMSDTEQLNLYRIRTCDRDKLYVPVKCDFHSSDECYDEYDMNVASYRKNLAKYAGKLKCARCAHASYRDNKTKCIHCEITLDSSNWVSSGVKYSKYVCTPCMLKYRAKLQADRKDRIEEFIKNRDCKKCGIKLTLTNLCTGGYTKSQYTCSECVYKYNRDRHLTAKIELMNAYGGKCNCCGETELAFLTIDHINGDGASHRKALGSKVGSSFYKWLKDNGYPKDNFQILCSNCNLAKHILGCCPHQKNVNGDDHE